MAQLTIRYMYAMEILLDKKAIHAME